MIGRVLGNRYEIVEKIGEGGMAIVYKAKCRLLNRFVAVKVLRAEFVSDEEFLGKFERESQAAASLSHPNIVNIYDVGTDEEIHYIVMEFVDGSTLKDYIKGLGVYLTSEEIIKISKQIAMAIDHAHVNGIIHRDIKPHNILFTDDGIVKVADFGIARAVTSSTIAHTDEAIGSVHYSSPEQARGGYADVRSDIYSLGILMFELATGRVPFEGDTPITVALKHLKEQVVPPSLINMKVTKSLEKVVLKCIQKDPNDRYQKVEHIVEDLGKLELDSDAYIEIYFNDTNAPTMKMPNLEGYEDMVLEEESNDFFREDFRGNEPGVQEPKRAKKTRVKKRGVVSSVVAALILSLIFGLVIFGGTLLKKEPQEFTVRNFIGYNVDEVAIMLETIGLTLEVIEEMNSSEYLANQIIYQDPKEGSKLKEGNVVRVKVSKGPVMVRIPNLTNKEIVDAKLVLENNKLVVGTIDYKFDDLPKGLVISQDPASGGTVEAKTVVNLVVSQGLEIKTVIMPSIDRKSLEDVKQLLSTLKLNLGEVTYGYSDDIEVDLSISQSVTPGSEVKEHTKVNIVISQGPEVIEGADLQVPEGTELPDGTVEQLIEKVFYVPTEFDAPEENVKVIKIEDGISTVVYENIHKNTDGHIKVVIKGSGSAKLNIYYGDVIMHTMDVVFE